MYKPGIIIQKIMPQPGNLFLIIKYDDAPGEFYSSSRIIGTALIADDAGEYLGHIVADADGVVVVGNGGGGEPFAVTADPKQYGRMTAIFLWYHRG